MMRSELKACPFCGKKGKLIHSSGQGWYMPVCENNNCVAGEDGASLIETKSGAIKIWNARPATTEEIEADFYKASEKLGW